jgi:predicted nuclease of predicted toxin-antitoxin system
LTLAEFSFLADENLDPEVIDFLRRRGLDVVSAGEAGLAGASDAAILEQARLSRRLVLTHDRDFGALVLAAGSPVFGIVFLRPGHIRAEFTIGTLSVLLDASLNNLTPPFLLVAVRTEDRVRIRLRPL